MDRTVADLGEIELVARVLEILAEGGPPEGLSAVIVGPGDDAAVLACAGDVVITTDSQHENVHFERAWLSAEQLGRRAIAVNASDLGAMGSRPRGFVVALAMPPSTPVQWVEGLARGLRDGARRYGAGIVGGDVAAVPDRVSINVSGVGERARGVTAVRAGARPGHRLVLTGWPGRAAAGRELLRAARDGVSEDARRCVAAFVDPDPPVELAVAAAEQGLLAAVMDVSDGVAIDLGRMCRASGVGAALDAEPLLADEVLAALAADLALAADQLVLTGGEDYQLLCAVEHDNVARLRELAARHDVAIRDVGAVVEAERGITLTRDGRSEPISETGWDHFSCP